MAYFVKAKYGAAANSPAPRVVLMAACSRELPAAWRDGLIANPFLTLFFPLPTKPTQIIHTSPRVRAAHNLLRRSPDGYMLSPCKSPTWVVVELCEQILITRIELANLELFSSMIRTIRVSVSDS